MLMSTTIDGMLMAQYLPHAEGAGRGCCQAAVVMRDVSCHTPWQSAVLVLPLPLTLAT